MSFDSEFKASIQKQERAKKKRVIIKQLSDLFEVKVKLHSVNWDTMDDSTLKLLIKDIVNSGNTNDI